jgi:hypothetical protein
VKTQKNTNVEGGFKLKFVFCFTDTTYGTPHSNKQRMVQQMIINMSTSFI